MSDFLSNLVSRSLGTLPVIQPRLPSAFEPATPYAGSFAETATRWEEGRREEPVPATFGNAEAAQVHSATDPLRVPAAPRRECQASAPYASSFGETATRWTNHRREELVEATLENAEAATLENAQVAQVHSAIDPLRVPAAPRRERQASVRSERSLPVLESNSGEADMTPNSPLSVSQLSLADEPAHESTNGFPAVGRPPVPPSELVSGEARSERVAFSAAPRLKLPEGDFAAPAALPQNVAARLNGSTATAVAPAMLRTESQTPERASSDLLEGNFSSRRQFQETVESHVKFAQIEQPRTRREQFATAAIATSFPLRVPPFKLAKYIPQSPHAIPSEPIVQVTIGRIEVRATSPQISKPKERSSSPVMSLNDYLQERSKRGGA
jgi:hypothetical protein